MSSWTAVWWLQLERDLEPLQQTAHEARNAALDAIQGKAHLIAAVQNPYANDLAFATEAFVKYKLPHLMEAAVAGDRESPLYSQCLKAARLYALATGFRSCKRCGGESDLPDDKRLLLEAYDEYRWEKRANATTFPSAQDVLSAQDEVMRRQAEDKQHRDHIEDLRGIKRPPKLSAPEFRQRQDIAEFTRPR